MTGALNPIGALSYNGARWRVTDVTLGAPAVVTVDYVHPFQVGDLITLSGMIKSTGPGSTLSMIQPTTAEWRVTAVPAGTKVTIDAECAGSPPINGWLTYPGWLPCLGQPIASGTYPALARRLMNNQFGTGMVLPNLAGHVFCVGLDTERVRVRAGVFSQVMNGAQARGNTGGESTHQTQTYELPTHQHPANAAADALRMPSQPIANLGSGYDGAGLAPGSGYMGRVVAEYGNQIWLEYGQTSGTYTPSGTPSAFGEPHENRPPAREMFPLIFAGSYLP